MVNDPSKLSYESRKIFRPISRVSQTHFFRGYALLAVSMFFLTKLSRSLDSLQDYESLEVPFRLFCYYRWHKNAHHKWTLDLGHQIPGSSAYFRQLCVLKSKAIESKPQIKEDWFQSISYKSVDINSRDFWPIVFKFTQMRSVSIFSNCSHARLFLAFLCFFGYHPNPLLRYFS